VLSNNASVYSFVRFLGSARFSCSVKEKFERMALTPFFGRSTAGSLWDPWDRNGRLFDPLVPVSRIWDAFDFGSALDSPAFSFSRDAQAIANTRLDWKETPDAHVFTADLPGLKKEEVKIEVVDNGSLRISGERHKEDVQDTDQWHRVERSSGRFMRQFRLPENVNADGISAKLQNGVLTVKAPKTKPDAGSASDVKSIDISETDK